MPEKQFSGSVLVTGGGGFLGSRVVDVFLQRHWRVKVLEVRQGVLEGRTDPGLEVVSVGNEGGMLDRSSVDKVTEGVDVICHLAIEWEKANSIGGLLDASTKGMTNLLESAKAHDVKHFLYASSAVVYGISGSPRVDEESICKPETWSRGPGPNYSVTKYLLERVALLYNNYQSLPSTILRIAVAFDDKKAFTTGSTLGPLLLKGDPIEVARGVGRASVHAEDVARAFYLAALKEESFGQVFNISNPATFITDLEIAELMAKTMGSKSKITVSPRPRLRPAIESIGKADKVLKWKPRKGKSVLKRSIMNTASSLNSERS